MVGKRYIHASAINWFPRLAFQPKKLKPNVIPKTPTEEVLNAPILKKPLYASYPSRKYPSVKERLSFPKPHISKRHLTDVETARPLPTTFAPGQTLKDFKTKPLIPDTKASYHYPYRYYEITLRRGLIGIPKKIKHIVQSIGLHQRHQVVWRLVSPRSAGQILKIKELVHVRLVNEIPIKEKQPTGYSFSTSLLNL
jgi:ribosomal protein L30/L7E